MQRMLAVSVLAATAIAQTTHTVGPNGFPQIDDAIAAANAGDLILIEPGSYEPFTCSKSITIQAQSPDTVSVVIYPGVIGKLCELDPGAAGTVHIVGIEFTPVYTSGFNACEGTLITSGRATFDQCVLRAAAGPALISSNATVHLQDCMVIGANGSSFTPSGSIDATASDITAVACEVYGGSVGGAWTGGGIGIRLTDCRLHASHSTIVGEPPSIVNFHSAHALFATSSDIWLSDCDLQGGIWHCALAGTATKHVARCTISFEPTGCPAGTAAPLLGVNRAAPLRTGQTFTLDYATGANQFVLVFASPRLGTVDWGPFLAQPSWLDETLSFTAAVTVADNNGAASVAWPIPANPALVGQTMWFKGISGAGFPLQASAVAGGVVQ